MKSVNQTKKFFGFVQRLFLSLFPVLALAIVLTPFHAPKVHADTTLSTVKVSVGTLPTLKCGNIVKTTVPATLNTPSSGLEANVVLYYKSFDSTGEYKACSEGAELKEGYYQWRLITRPKPVSQNAVYNFGSSTTYYINGTQFWRMTNESSSTLTMIQYDSAVLSKPNIDHVEITGPEQIVVGEALPDHTQFIAKVYYKSGSSEILPISSVDWFFKSDNTSQWTTVQQTMDRCYSFGLNLNLSPTLYKDVPIKYNGSTSQGGHWYTSDNRLKYMTPDYAYSVSMYTDTDQATLFRKMYVVYGSYGKAPSETPTKVGSRFTYWKNVEDSTSWKFDTPILTNKELVPAWTTKGLVYIHNTMPEKDNVRYGGLLFLYYSTPDHAWTSEEVKSEQQNGKEKDFEAVSLNDDYIFTGWKKGTSDDISKATNYTYDAKITVKHDVNQEQHYFATFAKKSDLQWGTVEYKWNSDYTQLTATRSVKDNPSIKDTETVGVAQKYVYEEPTCMLTGEMQVISEEFRNPAFKKQSDFVPVPTLEHQMKHYDLVPATETANGCKEHWTCEICHNSFLENVKTQGKPVSEEDLIIKMSKNLGTYVIDLSSGLWDMGSVAALGEDKLSAVHMALEGLLTYAEINGDITWDMTTKMIDLNLDNAMDLRIEPPEEDGSDYSKMCVLSTNSYEGDFVMKAEGDVLEQMKAEAAKNGTDYYDTVILRMPCVHNWANAVYTWSSDYTQVTASRTCKKDQSHVETETVGIDTKKTTIKAATCTTAGTKTVTSKAFKNDAFTVQTKTFKTEAAKGHTLTHYPKVAPTTSKAGNIEYWECSVCHKKFSNASGTNEITGSVVIPKLTASPTPAATTKPSATPKATTKPTTAPTTKPTTKPSATPKATTKPTTAPTTKPTTKPSATPKATTKPTTAPTVKPTTKPSATPAATAKPTTKPSATPAATAKPTTKPSATPVATARPTTAPSKTPAATTKPSATPAATAKPTTKPSATPKATTKPTTAPTTKPVTQVFTDVKSTAWYVKAVQYVYDNGIMSGKGSEFQPGVPVTREEFSQTLYNHIGKPEVPASVANPFPDVKAGKWFAKAVLWAKDKDIVKGYANGKFGVGDKITREQLAQMLYKYAKLRGYDMSATAGASEGYLDSNKRSDWSYTALDWAVSQGIISGKGTTGAPKSEMKLDPKGNATRAECAQMVMKLLQKNGL